MRQTYFVYQDKKSIDRQSDGVELCIVDTFHDNKIYFYCSEYEALWSSVEEIGDFDKEIRIAPNTKIRPASLVEICQHNLCEYVTTIKQYIIENNKILEINYIHLD